MATSKFSGPILSPGGFAPIDYNATTGAAPVIPAGFYVNSYTTGITAHAGGSQTNATPLTTQFNIVATVASTGDSVKLPAASPGLEVTIINTSAKTLAIFPTTGGAINGGSANASVNLPAGGSATYRTLDSTNWYGSGGPSAFSGLTVNGYTTYYPQVLAAAGATQGAAGAISNSVVIVTVTASTEGVRLPAAATGLEIRVHVPGTVGAKVYPASGAKINALSTNTSLLSAAGKADIFFARDTTRWVTMNGA